MASRGVQFPLLSVSAGAARSRGVLTGCASRAKDGPFPTRSVNGHLLPPIH
jgi:hypothetical protein